MVENGWPWESAFGVPSPHSAVPTRGYSFGRAVDLRKPFWRAV